MVVGVEQQEKRVVVVVYALQHTREHLDVTPLRSLLQKIAKQPVHKEENEVTEGSQTALKQPVHKEADEVMEGAQVALKFLQEKGGKATAKEMCDAMFSIVTSMFQSNQGLK
ncbi:hypothetical protein GOP47_0013180 [Adiantum capillus-veneris]|uniref:Uncharacterized protein n=1 Tax=Adiantum capillus-veneris TaxID=13818 RepID=A0A9D4ZD70_ADICA|nr:hypothetical protein GOP47_0013180 [Adiantum capillus-veneris]